MWRRASTFDGLVEHTVDETERRLGGGFSPGNSGQIVKPSWNRFGESGRVHFFQSICFFGDCEYCAQPVSEADAITVAHSASCGIGMVKNEQPANAGGIFQR